MPQQWEAALCYEQKLCAAGKQKGFWVTITGKNIGLKLSVSLVQEQFIGDGDKVNADFMSVFILFRTDKQV